MCYLAVDCDFSHGFSKGQ